MRGLLAGLFALVFQVLLLSIFHHFENVLTVLAAAAAGVGWADGLYGFNLDHLFDAPTLVALAPFFATLEIYVLPLFSIEKGK